MKKRMMAVLLLLALLPVVAQEQVNTTTKNKLQVGTLEFKPSVKSTTTAELGFTDTDDSEITVLGVAKNTPEFSEKISAFVRFNHITMKSIYFGPYANYDGKLNFRKYTELDKSD